MFELNKPSIECKVCKHRQMSIIIWTLHETFSKIDMQIGKTSPFSLHHWSTRSKHTNLHLHFHNIRAPDHLDTIEMQHLAPFSPKFIAMSHKWRTHSFQISRATSNSAVDGGDWVKNRAHLFRVNHSLHLCKVSSILPSAFGRRKYGIYYYLPVSAAAAFTKLLVVICSELHANSVGVKHCSFLQRQMPLLLLYTEFIIHSKSFTRHLTKYSANGGCRYSGFTFCTKLSHSSYQITELFQFISVPILNYSNSLH